jgi:3D (Asp-Asp-Asp) domain-containing protein
MPSRGLLGITAAGFCLLVLPATSGAGGGGSTLQQLNAAGASLAAKSRSAVLGLYSLDSRLATAQARLAALQTQARQLRDERASLDQQLRIARLDARLSQSRLAARVRFIYEHGTTSSLDVLMGAKSLEDAITQLDDYDRVAAVNAVVLTEVLSAKSRLTRLSGALAARRHALAATTRAVASTVAALESAHAGQTAYIARLASQRSLNSAQITRVETRARAAVALSQQLTAPAPAAPPAVVDAAPVTLTAPAVAGGRTLTVSTTGYALSGSTSTGLPVGWGVAAVDPSVIPLGTHLVVPGYGEAVAADTGSAIRGSTIDLWFPTVAQADAWGRRTVTIALD